MSHMLRDTFNSILNLESINDAQATKVSDFVIRYELKGTHPQAFNTFSLGVYKCLFTDDDRDTFVEMFSVGNPPKITTIDEIYDATIKLSIVDPEHKSVISNPFNLFISYLLHCLLSSKNIRSEKVRAKAAHYALKILQYKFFTSLINYYFPYPPDEDVMRAMFENLSNKFEIKVYGTWSKVMDARCDQLLTPSTSIHYRNLVTYMDDTAIQYFIADVQNRIRSQVKNVTAAFYQAKEEADTIRSYGSLGTNQDGETGLIDSADQLDSAMLNIYNDCMNVNKFLDVRMMRIVNSQFKNIHPDVFKTFLIAFSEYAVRMTKANKNNEVKKSNGFEIITGPELLVTTIIQQCYRYCTINRIPTNRPLVVIKAIKDVFSSSRISDDKILQIRKSLEVLVLELQNNRRDIILSGLRISFILYLLLLSFKYTGIVGK